LSAWEGRRVSKAEVKALTKAKATDIYRENYWNKVSGDDLPAGVDYATLDFAIHSGPARAVKMLQKVVGVDQDGVIGAKTLAAVRKIAADRIINELCDARLAWLKGLGTFSTFGKGWTSRVSRVRSRALAFSRDSAPVPSPVPQVPTGKAVQSDTSLKTVLSKPESWGPLGGLISGVSAMASGSGPMQWALAVAMIALVGIGLYFFIQRVRKEA
jgi:lysozyme family protein